MTIYPNDSGKKPNPNYIPPATVKPHSEMKWISVKDRLPEDGKLVVTYSAKTERIGSSDCLKSYIEEYGNYSEVSHWMPLPNLPNTDESDKTICLSKEDYEHLLEYKSMYENLCK